jgi:DNA-binding Xre family transcriptional regulator
MKKNNLEEKYQKVNEQRFATIVILCNILDTEKGVSDHIKSAICASLINMLERSMNDDDTPLVNLINNSIDNFCAKVEEQRGIQNYRDTLNETVDMAKKILNKINGKAKRIKEGEDILKGICLN